MKISSMEDRVVTCPQCGCEEEEELMSTCIRCGEEFCTMCESLEHPDLCESCELALENGEDE